MESVKRMAVRTPTRASMSPMHSSIVPMSTSSGYDLTTSPHQSTYDVLMEAKRDMKKLRKKARVRHYSQRYVVRKIFYYKVFQSPYLYCHFNHFLTVLSEIHQLGILTEKSYSY